MKKIIKIGLAIIYIIISGFTYAQNNLTISGTGITIEKGITVNNAGNIDISDNATGKGSLDNSGIITITGSLNNSSVGDVLGSGEFIFNGTNEQFIKGNNTFGYVTLDNHLADITVSGNMYVSTQIKFLNGKLNTSSSGMLTLLGNASVFGATKELSGASDNSYVNGPMIKTGNTNFIFPIGKSNAELPLHPISIELTDQSEASFMAEYFNASPLNLSRKINTVKSIANTEYWSFEKQSGNNTGYLSLYYRNKFVDNPDNLVVLHYDVTDENGWVSNGKTSVFEISQDYFGIRSDLVNSYGIFTYGTLFVKPPNTENTEVFNPLGGKKQINNTAKYNLLIYPNPIKSGEKLEINVKKDKSPSK